MSVAVPRCPPPPSMAAELPLRVQSASVAVPAVEHPAAYGDDLSMPPVMVRPETVAETPMSTWNTRLLPPPLIVTPAAGP